MTDENSTVDGTAAKDSVMADTSEDVVAVPQESPYVTDTEMPEPGEDPPVKTEGLYTSSRFIHFYSEIIKVPLTSNTLIYDSNI